MLIKRQSNYYNIQSESESLSVVSNSLRPHGLYSPWNSPGQNTGVGSLWLLPVASPGDLPNPGIKPRYPALQVDSLQAKPQRKPKNTGVGSLSLLQWIFQIQELNWGLLHCRQILYQLSYQGSPVQFSCSVMSDSLRPHELQHARPPCPLPTPGVHPNPCPSSR